MTEEVEGRGGGLKMKRERGEDGRDEGGGGMGGWGCCQGADSVLLELCRCNPF